LSSPLKEKFVNPGGAIVAGEPVSLHVIDGIWDLQINEHSKIDNRR